MDRETTRAYERGARAWIARRRPRALEDGRLEAFARRLPRGSRVADLGCGPGWYAEALRERGLRAIALDASRAMLREAGRRAPQTPRVCADLAALPLADGSLQAAFASACYQHLPGGELPAALARLHQALCPDAPVEVTLAELGRARVARGFDGGERELRFDDDPFGPRLFTLHTRVRMRALVEGAGFDRIRLQAGSGFWVHIRARRARSLPDLVRPGLRLLVCGLNPSLFAAERGIPFARPGNRFWPAARAARLVRRDRDPWAALERGLGFTDLVKRATARAAELDSAEYARGIARVKALVELAQPRAVCFVGLDGWRRAVDRRAAPGWVPGGFGGRPAYLMPSTSGLNARTSLETLAAHLRAAARGRPPPARR